MCMPAFDQALSGAAAAHAACRPSSAVSVDVTAPDSRLRRMLQQPAMRVSAGAQPALRVTPRPSCAGHLNDLHVYDPAAGAWSDLSAALRGIPPSPRGGHGFTSAGGKLYVHGGWDSSGVGGGGGAEGVGMGRPPFRHVLAHLRTVSYTHSSASFSLADIPSTNNPINK
jgi:hypothetical protein